MSFSSKLLQVPARRVTLVLLLALLTYLAWLSFPSSEAVRLRNALLIEPGQSAAFDWTPAQAPADFKRDFGAPTAHFTRAVQSLRLAQEPSEWRRALAIARHVQAPMANPGPIFGDLDTTYEQIQRGQGGYCADATDVFLALSKAAGLFARQWGFSFDRFGGLGHAVNEIYDSTLKQWVFIDVFQNHYMVDARTQRPLSALEVRAALLKPNFEPQVIPIVPGKHVDFRLDFYRRGAAHWFLWWGNNVFELDEKSSLDPLSRILPKSATRAAEQFWGVARGVYPGMRVLPSADNRAHFDAMLSLRTKLLFIALAGVVLSALLLAQLIAAWRRRAARRRARGAQRLSEAHARAG